MTTAKNYLKQEEIDELNRIVAMYLDYAEDQAKRRKSMTMREWEGKLDAFLSFNERDVPDFQERRAKLNLFAELVLFSKEVVT